MYSVIMYSAQAITTEQRERARTAYLRVNWQLAGALPYFLSVEIFLLIILLFKICSIKS